MEKALKTPEVSEMRKQEQLRAIGEGKPHTDATLRLFGHKESDIRLTLYRDKAAWCPYCQKVWIMLEEKKIPYRIVHINMTSYGEKPQEFLKNTLNGKLPAIELDGDFHTDSVYIMQLIDDTFSEFAPVMAPKEHVERAQELFDLEREVYGMWSLFLFQNPVWYKYRKWAEPPMKGFYESLDKVDDQLRRSWEESDKKSVWFLAGDAPSFIDLQFITHFERMVASAVYWKAIKIRDPQKWPHIDRWMSAFEERESYQATRSDHYTHVMNIPPQCGEAYPDINNERGVREAMNFIGGASWWYPAESQRPSGSRMQGDSWALPLSNTHDSWEPIPKPMQKSQQDASSEAAYMIIKNHKAISLFACRGTGQRGSPAYKAPLADPCAKPNLDHQEDVDKLLRITASGLLNGQLVASDDVCLNGLDADAETRQDLSKCVRYLRDRIGVPRDMSLPAAQVLRAHLTHLSQLLLTGA